MRSNVVVDADGVVLDFLTVWETMCTRLLGRQVVTVNASYDLAERYEISHHEKLRVWQHFYDADLWRTLPLLHGADLALKSITQAGHVVHIVTAIDEVVRDSRMHNLLAHRISDFTMHCTGRTKAAAFEELNPIVVFDDNPAHHAEAEVAGVPHRVLITGKVVLEAPHATVAHPSLAQAAQWFLDVCPGPSRALGQRRPI